MPKMWRRFEFNFEINLLEVNKNWAKVVKKELKPKEYFIKFYD